MQDDWYRPDIPRKELKALMARGNGRGLADFGLWATMLCLSGYVAYRSAGTYWVIPAFLLYGTIYSSCDARWHECAHGTPFRTRWMNEAFYFLCSLMNMKEGTYTRWSHTRHHTETIMVGLDPEIQVMRPADLKRMWRMTRAALDSGVSLAVFPEGQRTRDGHVGPFKDGVFRMAVQFGTPIVPVSLVGSYEFNKKRSWFIRPGTITVCLHDVIETKDLRKEDVPALRDRVHTIVSTPVEEVRHF